MRKKSYKTVDREKRRKVVVENLEPRTLFSADVVSASLALDFIADHSLEQNNWLADTGQSDFSLSNDKGVAYPIQNNETFAGVLNDREVVHSRSELIGFEEHASGVIVELEPALAQSHQLIVIDERVDDSEALLQDVLNNGDSNTEFKIIRLAEGSDGIEAITSALSAQKDQTYNAVHIITHGDDAELQLGSTQLNSSNLQLYQSELSSWSAGLSLDADILLYGCDVAQTEHGEQFVDQISQWTGADIASSDDTTGNADLGGNWELEYKVGEIDTDIVFSKTIQSDYSGVFETTPQEYALWTTTRWDVTGSNAPGLDAWTDQDVIQLDGLTLETGDGTTATTDATFSEAIDFNTMTGNNADMDALHVVSAPITVQGVDLQEGDLLFSGLTNTQHSSTNTLTSVNPHNVYVFSPDVAGDYSSGTFEEVINRTGLGLVNAINGFTLVESDTTVGDQDLTRGDFLYTTQFSSDIHWFDSSTETSSILIHGADIGLTKVFRGIELVESSAEVGGINFDSGNLLVVIDNTSPIGNNAIQGTNHDVIRLEVSTTGVGNTMAIASTVFDGSDVGIDASERLDGLSLNLVAAVNDAPELENLGPLVDFTVGGGPITLDADVTVVDSELTEADNFDGAQLQIMRLGGANAVDQFGTTGLLAPMFEGTDVVYDGAVVGIADVDSGGEVLITFNSNATNADVNGVLQSITFQNTVNNPSTSLELEWIFDDGNMSAQGTGGAQTTSGILSVGFVEAPVVVVNQLNVDEHSANGTSAGSVTTDDAAAIAALLAADTSLVHNEFTGKFYRHVTTAERFSTALTEATSATLNGTTGQLLTIRSLYENSLAVAIADGSPVWLGATDETTSGEWRWLDGTAEGDQFWSGQKGGSTVAGSFANWDVEEPNNSQQPSSEDYAALDTDGEWYDWSDAFNHRLDYIVEWDAADVLANRTFALTDDANGRFAIDSDTGEITIADDTQLDFETDITHDVTVAVDYGVEVVSQIVTIDVNDLNDPPEFINLGPAVDFTPDDGPVVLDPDATVVDIQLTPIDNFDGTQLQILRQGGANVFDQFSATGMLDPLVEGTDVTYAGKIVGTADIASGGEVLISFNSNATNADVNGVMQSIAYENTSGSLDNFVNLEWTFDDGTATDQGPGGAQSITETLRVRIFPDFNVDENSANGTAIGVVPTDDTLDIIEAVRAANPDLIYDETTGKFYQLGSTEEKFSVALDSAITTTLNGVNGQLLTVRSDYENTLALTITGGERVWLGASDAKTEGDWHWLDGDQESEQFWSGNQSGSVIGGNYNNWEADEPNNAFNEDFAAIENDGTWFDWSESNNHKTNYIIEWDAAEVAANINFTLSDDANGRFAIDPDTGEITVADGTQLDFETDITHDVTVDIDYGAYVTSEVLTIDVNNLNDPPEFVNFGPAVSYTTGDNPVVLNPVVTVVDTELTPADSFNGATLHLQRVGGANAFDAFSATGMLDPLTEGNDVTYGGKIVGTADIASGGEVFITFNNNATNADVDGVLQSIAYQNTNNTPESNVNLEWTINDGTLITQGPGGAKSTTAILDVRIHPDLNVDEYSVDGTSIGFIATDVPQAIALTDAIPGLVYDEVTGKFYQFVDTPASFSEALNAATTTSLNGIDGQLLTIRSAYENDLAVSISGAQRVWLGATDITTEGAWHWQDGIADDDQFWSGTTTGSAIGGSYQNWDKETKEPNNASNEDVAAIKGDGLWFDWRDFPTIATNYIIEWDAAEVLASRTFSLADDANGRFAIDSSTGEITVADGTQLDFETDMSHDVTVEADNGASVTSEVFTIDVNDLNDAPVLDTNATFIVPPVAEDDLNPAGDTVANILASGGLNSITDDDTGAVEGIAVYTVDDTNGTWEYSLDGNSWTAIGAVDTASALLLDPAAMMRFVPDADFSGTAGFFFHAWDQTQGSNGQLFDIRDTGGSTAFSSIASDEVTVTVNPVNDAPVLASGQNPRFETITEDDRYNAGETVASVLAKLGDGITDIDANASEGIAIFINNSNAGNWQYSIDAGTTWHDVGTVSSANALLLSDTDLVRMNPNGTMGHLANFGFRAWDQTVGTAGTKVDISALGGTGGTAAFSSNTLSAQITVTDINDDPFNAGVMPAEVSVTEDISTTVDLSAIDLMDVDDNGLSMSVRLTTATGGMITTASQAGITTTGNGTDQVTLIGTKADLNAYLDNPTNISYLHSIADNFGDNADTIRVVVSDLGNSGKGGGGLVGFGFTNVHITPVNDTPVAIDDTDYTSDEDTTLNVITGGILDNDTDDDPLSIILLTTTTNGTLTLNPDGTFEYVPNANFFGTDSFTYQLQDPSGDTSAVATATITVNSVNDVPLTGSFTETWLADVTPLTETNNFSYDENTGRLNAQILIDGQEYYHGVGIHPNAGVGVVEYDLNGATNFSAIVGVNDTLTKLAEVIFTAYVNDVEVFNSGIVNNNTPPIPVSIDTGTGSVLRLEIDSIGSEIVDHAIWADAKLIGGITQPTTISVAETAVNGTLVGTYTGSDHDTADTLTYSLSDNALGRFAIDTNTGEITVANASLLDYETATSHPITVRIDDGTAFVDHAVKINLSEVNEAAIGTDATIKIAEDTPHTFQESDFGYINTDGDSFEGILIRSLPSNGSLTLNDVPLNNGQPVKAEDITNVVYTPDANVNGVAFDSFDFSVRDSRHLFSPTINTLTFDVESVNDAPDARADNFDTDEDVVLTGNVLVNDSDVENDPISVNTTPVTQPGNGTVVLNANGTFTYTPEPHFFGTDSFVYEVSDVNGGTGMATVSISVNSVNDPPVAANDSLITDEDTLITGNVLSNDSDQEDDTLSATVVADPVNGSLVLNADGSFDYTPTFNYNGTDSFTYQVDDGNGGTDTAVVDITIDSVNDTPVFSNLDNSIIYTPGGPAVTLDTDVTIFEPERSLSDNFIGNTLRIGPATGDHSIGINGTPANAGDPVSVNGIVIGTVGSNSLAGTKSFTFNANATNALVDEFMQSLTYEFTGTVTPTSVTVDWTFLDAGKLNDTGVTTVNFTPNQLPVVDLNGPLVGDDVSLTYIENEGLTKIAPDAVTFDFNENDITLLNLDAAGFAANTISELAFGGTSVTAGTPSSGTVPIGTSTIAYSYNGVDGFSFTNNAGADEPISTNVLNALIQTIQYQNPSDNPTASSIDFRFTAQDAAGQLSETGTSTVTIVPVNDPPTGMNNPVTIAEDTEYTLLPLDFGFSDVDGDSLNRVFIDQLPVNGQLLFKGNPFAAGDFIHVFDLNQGNLTYQPNVNENGADSFMFSVSDDGGTANGGIDRDQTPRTFTFDVVPVNDVPTTTPVTLTPVAEDSTPRLITQAELLANATDIDGDALTATDLTIASGSGILTDNMDGTWSYTPAANDDTDVSFNYNITDNTDNVASSAALDIMPVNDSPQTASVILTPVAEDSGARIITQAELLANATDTEGNTLTATGLTIAAGNGTLDNNNDGTWIYTPASNDDTGAGFIYTITDGTNNVPGSATLDVLPVNDVPQTTPIILSPTAEDSVRTITQAELLANATDIENDTLTAGNLSITTGNGSLIDNGDGTWNYTPASNDDSDVSFAYIIADATGNTDAVAQLDITPVNDAPQTTPAVLNAVVEDSGIRIITQTELLASATDTEGDALTADGLIIITGNGTLNDNEDGTWNYTPASNDDTDVSFVYTITDNINHVVTSATLDIIPVNDAPQTTPVVLTPVAEESGARLITQAELLVNATDTESDALTAAGLTIDTGNGTLVDNGDGTWSYTPASNDDADASFAYTITDDINTTDASATLNITPVNDTPQTTPVILTPITEDSGARIITQAELLANASDIEGDDLSANGLMIATGNGSLLDNADGTWSYTPANNDDTNVSFTYSVTDGASNAAGVATLDIIPVNDAPQTTSITLPSIAEDSGARLITQAELLANAMDIEGDNLTATDLSIATGDGSLIDNNDGTWSYTPADNDDTDASFVYAITDATNVIAGLATLDITLVNDGPQTTPVVLPPVAEDSGVRLITQAELLANATDIEDDILTANGLTVDRGSLTDNGDGTWNYTPAANDNGTASFNYNITDNTSNVAGFATLDITPVNDIPQTAAVALTPIAEDSGARLITQAELIANATDIEGDDLIANSLTIATGNGSLLDNGDGTWNYTPASDDNTDASFNYTITDATNNVSTSATLDITAINDAPFGTDGEIRTAEDTAFILSRDNFGFSDIRDAGDQLSAVRIEVLPTAGQLQLDGTALDAGDTVTVSQIDAGQLSYLPGTDRFGPDDASFEFSVIDDNTQPGDSIALASNQLTVSVDPVSDAPTGSDSIQIAVEDTSYVFATADFGFTDPSDGDTLTGVFIEQLPAGGTLTLDGAAVNAGDFIITNEIAAGTLQYLTATNANGAAYDTIGFRVMDSGTDGPASIDSAVRQLTFDVLDVNDAPAAENNTITTAEDTEYVLGQSDFSFSDVADGNAFSSITVTTLPDLGTLLHQGIAVEAGDTISSAALDAGVLVYQPPLNVSTPVTDATELAPNGFSFSVTDDGGLARGGENTSIEQFITIDLTPVNDPPVLVSKEATVDEGGTIVIDSALLSGEDPDDSGLDELELTLTTLPLHGQLLLDGEVITAGTSLTLEAIEAGSLSYVHDSSETSADGFNVSLADGGEDGALPAEGRFELAINEVIDAAPELNPDALQLAFGQSFDSSEGQLLASGFSSLNNGSLSDNTDWLVELEVPPSHGTVELQADGTFTYVHNGSAILNDEFSYRVTNEDGVFTIATVAVTIEPRIAQALEESSNTFEAPTEQPEALTTEEPAEQEVTQASEEPEPEAQPARQAAPLLPDNNSIGNTRNTAILTQVETRELPGVNSSQTELVTRQAIAVTQHRDVIGVVASQYDLQELSTTTYDLTLDVHIPVLTISPSNPVFQNALTQLDNDFAELEEEGGARYELATDSVLGASFSASVGALAWILRGGAMFGSMMAFTPLWKFIEIGQVSVMVGGTNGRSKDNPGGEDDQVESLFDDSK